MLAFVNGMGGTPLIELYIVYRELNKFLQGRGITIERNLIGNYITSLEMAGCSITLLKLDDDLSASGTRPSTRRPCAGAEAPVSIGATDVRAWIGDFADVDRRAPQSSSCGSTRRSATATTGRTWTAA